MARRERDQLNTPVCEKRVGTHQERVGALPQGRNERWLEVALRTGVEENHLLSGCAGRGFDQPRLCLRSETPVWIYEQGNRRGAGHQLTEQLYPFRH